MASPSTPSLLPVVAEKIPAALRAHPRWACWRAVWSDKRGKFDKIPCHPSGYGLSTKRPDAWVPFEQALAAYTAAPGRFAGIGYLMTGEHGLVGVDLDRCVDGSTIAPWAVEILDQLGSYAELSPSGTGLRVAVQGEVPFDWNNHDVGIEVYAGHTPRFLTFTGQRLRRASETVDAADPQALADLAQRYARERETATVITLAMPDLVDELLLPDLGSLDLPYRTRDFLVDGVTSADRSRDLFTAAIDLYSAGLGEAEVLSVLAANPHAMGVALDHRRQDPDRALMYLWVEHAQKAKGRASSKVATADDFEDVRDAQGAQTSASPAPAAKRPRFAFEQAAEFIHGQPLSWLIKGVLPKADVGAVYGESTAGKSFFMLDLCLAIARGEPWRGHKVTQGAVAYVVAEGKGGFKLRLRAASEYHGLDLAGLPLFLLGDAPNLLEKGDVKDLTAALRQIPGLALVVMDTLAQTTPGANENSGEDMGRALAHCRAISTATGAMVMLVAHSGKDSAKGVRGWSGIKGALDVEICVERSDKWRAATVTKMKDGVGEGDEHPFGLATVVLGQDEEGEDITSCVVTQAEAGQRTRLRPPPKGAVQQLVLRTAQSMLDLGGELQVTALIETTAAELPMEQGKRDQRRAHVMRALENLVGAGHLSTANGVVNLL